MGSSEDFIRDSGFQSCLTSVREIIERYVAPYGIRCDVTGGDSLWDRVLVHQLVMVRTLSMGGPGILSGNSMSYENVIFDKITQFVMIIGSSSLLFNPLCDIVNNYQSTQISKRYGNEFMKSIHDTSKFSTTRIGFKGIWSLFKTHSLQVVGILSRI